MLDVCPAETSAGWMASLIRRDGKECDIAVICGPTEATDAGG
jgi:hypothetical protein